MRVLVGCEESQAVTKAFRKLGHEAYSCDLLPCSGGHPEWHKQTEFFSLIRHHREWPYKFDIVISFPPCTDLSVSGAKHFSKKRLSGEQEKSIKFFLDVWRDSDVVENPIGIMNTPKYLKEYFPHLYDYAVRIGFPFKPSQIIQPWQFGDKAQKSTCLWIKKLPNLIPTNIVERGEFWEHTRENGKKIKMPMWYFEALKNSRTQEQRRTLRSKTFPGIAKAMADQWGGKL